MTRLALSCLAAVLLVGSGEAPRLQAPAPPRNILEQAYRSNNLGAAWLERFEYQQAANAFREALRFAPALAIARFNLALALLYDGKLEPAEQELQLAAPAIDSPHADYVLGLIARAQGRGAAAAAPFERVLQRDPHDPAAAVMLGQVRLQQGDARGAIGPLQTALDLEPHNATAAYNLSIALARAGRAEEGRQMLARFQSLRESGTATTMGNAYLEQGRYAEAIVSTGAEPDLVDRAVPSVRFTADTIGAAAGAAATAADPVGRQFHAADLDAAGRRRIATALAGAATLFDADGDGDLDLLEADGGRERLWRNTRGRFALVSAARFPRPSPDAVATGLVAGDYNNDGRPDVLVLRYGGPALYRNDGGGRFTDVTARAGLRAGATELPLTAAFADLDHDGDLDIVIPGFVDLDGRRATKPLVFPDDFPAAAARVWRNNGDGTFADMTDASGVSAGRGVATVPTDFDLLRDVDLLIAGDDGRLALFKNQRDGSFRDVARESGLTPAAHVSSLAAGDLNRDGRTDFVVAHRDSQTLFALSSGRNRFRLEPAAGGMTAVIAAQLVDYDNDGLLDLMAWTRAGARLLRSLGDGWQEVTEGTLAGAARGVTLPPLAAGRAVAIGDLDGDGDQDVVVRDRSGVRVLRNDGGNRRGALAVRLAARVSNRSAAGSKIEVRAGSLLIRRETSAATPAAAPVDLVFGLGGRPAADAVRVLWPAGIVQAELQPPGRALVINELDRKPSSCPYLFTWNGSRFEFVTDFLGGGELGYWAAPGARSHPDSDEYVRIPSGALEPKDGRYELRITNELEEVLYLDHVHLAAVTHPISSEIYPNEGLVSPPFPRPMLYTVRNRRAPLGVVDDHGHDVTDAIRALDRRYPDDFTLTSIRGYAEPHALTIRIDTDASFLLLTGWTDYAFSSDNVAASQRGLHLSPPALQVRDGGNGWRTAIAEIGIPVGRPQTVVVDLRRPELEGRREIRIVTNMRVYWDRIAAADTDDRAAVETARLDPAAATLEWRGFSAEVSPDRREPFAYDYARVTPMSPWKTMAGRYTPVGDVRPLLGSVDDRFVVARPGDQVSVSFDATPLRPVRDGWTRTFLLYADGFSKEMDLNSASPDQVAPMPFHGMRAYPPAGGAARNDTLPEDTLPARTVATPVPSLDALLLLARPSPAAAGAARRPPRPGTR